VTPLDAALLLVLSLLWGGSFLFIRVAVPSVGPVALVIARLLIGAVLLYAFARATRRPLALRPHARPLAVLGLLNAALPYVLISAAELRLTASFAAVLNATVPLFAATFGAIWLRERLTARRGAGLLAGLAGVCVMVGWSPAPMTRDTLLAVLAMLAGSASYAAAGIYARLRLRGLPTHALALGQQLGALAWLALPGLVWRPREVPPPAAAWSVLALGVLSTAVAYLLYFQRLERVGPTRTATVTYLLPVVGILWGTTVLGEHVTTGMLVGLGTVLASVLLVNDVRLTRAPRTPAEPARARAA
jgi:drug/metabolite transporter (DMT)-like permease